MKSSIIWSKKVSRGKRNIIIAVSSCLIVIFATGIYFVRREWSRYRENNPLYIVPTAYDFPYKDYHHNKRIHFDGFSLLVPDDFFRQKNKSRSKWYKSSYSAIIVRKDRINTSKSFLEGLNIHYDSEFAAELYILSKTPDDCISINPGTIMRNYAIKISKSLVEYLEVQKIYYHDFGTYSVIAKEGRKGYDCMIFHRGSRYAQITYVPRLGLFDQNTINQILSTIEFDK